MSAINFASQKRSWGLEPRCQRFSPNPWPPKACPEPAFVPMEPGEHFPCGGGREPRWQRAVPPCIPVQPCLAVLPCPCLPAQLCWAGSAPALPLRSSVPSAARGQPRAQLGGFLHLTSTFLSESFCKALPRAVLEPVPAGKGSSSGQEQRKEGALTH